MWETHSSAPFTSLVFVAPRLLFSQGFWGFLRFPGFLEARCSVQMEPKYQYFGEESPDLDFAAAMEEPGKATAVGVGVDESLYLVQVSCKDEGRGVSCYIENTTILAPESFFELHTCPVAGGPYSE